MAAVRRHGTDVSIDQMAESAGVSKPVLYAEFGDKLGVVDAIARVTAGHVEATVVETLAESASFDLQASTGAIVGALVDLVEDEPQIYAFLVRSMRTGDRSFLDNALVRVVHEKAALLVHMAGAEIPADVLPVLTDGLFGFVFAAVESWIPHRGLSKARLVASLTSVIRAGLLEAASAH
jgi:AcrR family transcriptional regulator